MDTVPKIQGIFNFDDYNSVDGISMEDVRRSRYNQFSRPWRGTVYTLPREPFDVQANLKRILESVEVQRDLDEQKEQKIVLKPRKKAPNHRPLILE